MSEPIDYSHALFTLDIAIQAYLLRKARREVPRGDYDASGRGRRPCGREARTCRRTQTAAEGGD